MIFMNTYLADPSSLGSLLSSLSIAISSHLLEIAARSGCANIHLCTPPNNTVDDRLNSARSTRPTKSLCPKLVNLIN